MTGTDGRAGVCAACEVVWRQKIIAAAKDAKAIPAIIKKTCRECFPVIRIPMAVAIACLFSSLKPRFIRFPSALADVGAVHPDYTGLAMSGALNFIKIAPQRR